LDFLYSSQKIEGDFNDIAPQLFASFAGNDSIHFPLPDSGTLDRQVIVMFTTSFNNICLLFFFLVD
jgi:phage/plasmid-associated DNA primase